MKTNGTFNLNKNAKRFMATILNKETRLAYKNAMIAAQLAEEQFKKNSAKNKDPKNKD